MNTLTLEIKDLRATDARIDEDCLTVDLSDGRSLSVPLAWFPRLLAGNRRERTRWRLIGNGEGLHWPDLDEDVSLEALLAGRGSMESQRSIAAWLESRRKSRRTTEAKNKRKTEAAGRTARTRG
jgi:hypothetical protein